jgi:hypothetical protein
VSDCAPREAVAPRSERPTPGARALPVSRPRKGLGRRRPVSPRHRACLPGAGVDCPVGTGRNGRAGPVIASGSRYRFPDHVHAIRPGWITSRQLGATSASLKRLATTLGVTATPDRRCQHLPPVGPGRSARRRRDRDRREGGVVAARRDRRGGGERAPTPPSMSSWTPARKSSGPRTHLAEHSPVPAERCHTRRFRFFLPTSATAVLPEGVPHADGPVAGR